MHAWSSHKIAGKSWSSFPRLSLCTRCACTARRFERFPIELARVLIVGFFSLVSFVCQGPGNTCNTYTICVNCRSLQLFCISFSCQTAYVCIPFPGTQECDSSVLRTPLHLLYSKSFAGGSLFRFYQGYTGWGSLKHSYAADPALILFADLLTYPYLLISS